MGSWLALEIQQNSATVQAGSAQSLLQDSSEIWEFGLTDPRLAAQMWSKYQSENDLTEIERQYFISWTNIALNNLQAAHLLHEKGLLDDQVFEAYEYRAGIAKSAPYYNEFWDYAKRNYTRSFQGWMEGISQ